MAKEYPYFKWFPKDAEADEKYSAMDDAELGFFHRCMNKSWMNEGIPIDPEERARVMRTPLAIANEYWRRVGRSFVASDMFPGKLVNPRQEIERIKAIDKTRKARESANVRYQNQPKKQEAKAPQPKPKDPPSENPNDSQLQEIVDAFDRHQCFHNLESKDHVVRLVMSMNGEFDWQRFRKNHGPYCDFWAEKGWNFCRVTFLGCINAGMPGSPAAVGKPADEVRSGLPTARELRDMERRRAEGLNGKP